LRRRLPAGWISARFDLAKLEPAFCGTPVVESPGSLLPSSAESNTIHFQEIFMKPIPQTESNQRHVHGDSRAPRGHRNFPLTDYSYQSTAKAGANNLLASGKTGRISRLRMFRKLSSDFFGAETSRDYVAEFALFALIAGVSAWPIISMIAALYRMLK
jgi:hypothetical protein